MNYNKIISYIYALFAVGFGTYFCITYIYLHQITIDTYYDKDKKETIGIIKSIHCYYNDSCYSDIEYTVNNVKYLNNVNIPNNLAIDDKVKLKYNPLKPNDPNDLRVYHNYYIYSFIYIILFIICIILLWIFLFIVILFSNFYNKFIFLFYAIFLTIIVSYTCLFIINNNYNNDYSKYNNYNQHTTGIIKSQDDCRDNDNDNDNDNDICYSNIEYLIDGIKYNVKLLTYHYKIGENVKVYYNKDNLEEIIINDKTEYKSMITIIILIIMLLFLWIFLFYNIPFILNDI